MTVPATPDAADVPRPGVVTPEETHRVLFGIVAVGWFAFDQLSKWWAVSSLGDGTIDVVGSLRFQLAVNHGASFSLGTGLGAWIGVLALVVVGFLVWQGRSVRSRLSAVAMGLIVGGALGNVADRAFRGDGFFDGGVIDFIDLQWWPVFNVADVGVVCGAILLVISMLRAAPDDGTDAPSADTSVAGPTDGGD